MTHERAQELILDLAYGELAPDDAREVARHIEECSECAAEWARIASTRRASSRLADPRDDHRRDAILSAARQAVARPPARRRSRAAMWTVGAGMAVAVIVGGVTLKLTSGRPVDRLASVAPKADVHERERDAAGLHVAADAAGDPARDPARDSASAAASGAASGAASDSGRFAAAPAPPRRPAAAPRQERSAQAPEGTGQASRSDQPSPARRAESGGSKAASREEVASAAPPPSGSVLADAQQVPGDSVDEARSGASEARGSARAAAASPGEAPDGAAEARSGAPAAAPVPPDSRAAAQAANDRALPARDRALRSRAPVTSERADASRAVVADVESLLASGALAESSRPLTCGADALEQRSWADGERIRKVRLTARDGTTVEGWYDREGRLRALHARSTVPEPIDLRRELDEHGALVAEERRGASARALPPWLPPRDPGQAPADGCRWR
jgi:hypothetical protein